ncbi:hypothetical protein GCM10009540_37850 [Streptomyces turgidiscabies]
MTVLPAGRAYAGTGMLIAATADSELPITALRFSSEPTIRPPPSENAAAEVPAESSHTFCNVSICALGLPLRDGE